MSKPNYQRGPCPLQAAIENALLAKTIADAGITAMSVDRVHFMQDIEPEDGVYPLMKDINTVGRPPRLGQYGDVIVVFKVLERSQE